VQAQAYMRGVCSVRSSHSSANEDYIAEEQGQAMAMEGMRLAVHGQGLALPTTEETNQLHRWLWDLPCYSCVNGRRA